MVSPELEADRVRSGEQLVAQDILASIPNISQVFIELTSKPPATTEWE